VAACGTDDVLRESAIIGFHGIARILLFAVASCPLLDSLSGLLKTAQTSRPPTGFFF
jgi:hypothetical protein